MVNSSLTRRVFSKTCYSVFGESMKRRVYTGNAARWLGLLAVAAILAACGDNAGDDLLARRDGTSLKGKLENCTVEGCVLSGTFVPRPLVQSIRLGQQKAQDVKDPRHDEVQLTDASVRAETMITIDAAKVTTNQQTYPRERVAWIYLAPRPGSGAANSADAAPPGARRAFFEIAVAPKFSRAAE